MMMSEFIDRTGFEPKPTLIIRDLCGNVKARAPGRSRAYSQKNRARAGSSVSQSSSGSPGQMLSSCIRLALSR